MRQLGKMALWVLAGAFGMMFLNYALAYAAPPVAGAISVACDLDLNGDGEFGSTDDCNACDGSGVVVSNHMSHDYDNDGVAEDLYYIKTDTGADTSTCGTTASPCKSLKHAVEFRANGNGGNAEDAFCIQGTLVNGPVAGVVIPDGVTGTVTYPQNVDLGDRRDFQGPKDATLILPWDTDNDGDYRDETCVFDGGPNKQHFALTFEADQSKYFTVAHCEFRDYGSVSTFGLDGSIKKGAINMNNGCSWCQVRSCTFTRINSGQWHCNQNVVFRLYLSSATSAATYIWIENNNIPEFGSYVFRGGVGCAAITHSKIRIRNNTATMLSKESGTTTQCNNNSATDIGGSFWKVWGLLDDVELGYNIVDGNLSGGAWNPTGSTRASMSAFIPNDAAKGLSIFGNDIIDMRYGVSIQQDQGACSARKVSDLEIDANLIGWRTLAAANKFFTGNYYTTGFIVMQTPNGAEEYVDGLTVTNNFGYVPAGAGIGAGYRIWNANDNTSPCSASPSRTDNDLIAFNGGYFADGPIRFAAFDFTTENPNTTVFCGPASIQFRDNYAMGVASDESCFLTSSSIGTGDFDNDFNICDSGAAWNWAEQGGTSLAVWRTRSGQGASSQACDIGFDNGTLTPDLGSPAIAAGDPCASDAGVVVTPSVDFDFYRSARNFGSAPEVGPHELAGDSPGVLQFTTADYAVGEAAGTVSILVRRTGGSLGAASITISSSDGTATAGTCPTNDYVALAPTVLSWIAGESGTKSTTVTICDDAVDEFGGTEIVNLALTLAVGAALGSLSSATVTITDNDVAGGNEPKVDLTDPGDAQTFCDTGVTSTATLLAFNVGSGTSQILVVAVGAESSDVGPACDLASATVTWNGSTLSLAGSHFVSSTSTAACSGLFYLLAPAVATSDVVVTFGGTVVEKHVVAFVLQDALQTGPEVIQTIGKVGPSDPITDSVTTLSPQSLMTATMTWGAGIAPLTDVGTATIVGTQVDCTTAETVVSEESKATAGALALEWDYSTGALGKRFAGVIAVWGGAPTTAPTTTTTTTTLNVCGDGIVQGTEECDDGDLDNHDVCLNNCTDATCGDNVVCNSVGCTTGPGSGLELCDGSASTPQCPDTCTGGCDCPGGTTILPPTTTSTTVTTTSTTSTTTSTTSTTTTVTLPGAALPCVAGLCIGTE